MFCVGFSVLTANLAEAQSSPSDAHVAEARAAFNAGRAAYNAGNNEEAARQLRHSLELEPRAAAAFNLAVVESARGAFLETAQLAEALLAGTYGPLADAQREEVGALLAAAENQCARLEIIVSGREDAWLRIDGEEQPFDGTTVLRLLQGTHRIETGADGVESQHTELALVNGERRTLRFRLASPPGMLVVTGPSDAALEIEGVARGIGRVEASVQAGTYQVGPQGGPFRAIDVTAGRTQQVDLEHLSNTTTGSSRRPRRLAIALSAVAVIGAAVAVAFLLQDDKVEPDPAFGVFEALRLPQ